MKFHISQTFSSSPDREGYSYVAQVSGDLTYYVENYKKINAWLDRSGVDYLKEYALYFFKTEQDLALFLMRWNNEQK